MQNTEDANPSVPNQEEKSTTAKVVALVVVIFIVLGVAIATVPGLRSWFLDVLSLGERSAQDALLRDVNTLGERVSQDDLLTEVEMLDRVNAIDTEPLSDAEAQSALNRLENL